MSSINFSTIKDTLYDWVYNDHSVETIWSDDNGPQPIGLYYILRISAIDKIGHDYIDLPDNSGISTIVGNREFTLNIQSKGAGAISALEDIRSSLEKPSILSLLRSSKIIYVDDLGISNLTGLDDTLFIERGSLDILFRTASEITDDIGFIEKVEIESKYNDIAGNQVYTEDLTIDINP